MPDLKPSSTLSVVEMESRTPCSTIAFATSRPMRQSVVLNVSLSHIEDWERDGLERRLFVLSSDLFRPSAKPEWILLYYFNDNWNITSLPFCFMMIGIFFYSEGIGKVLQVFKFRSFRAVGLIFKTELTSVFISSPLFVVKHLWNWECQSILEKCNILALHCTFRVLIDSYWRAIL